MRKLLAGAALAALLAFSGPPARAAGQSATASPEIYWTLTVDVAQGKLADFKALIAKIVAAVEANEPGALEYEYSVASDGQTVNIVERYADNAAVVTHLDNFGKSFGKDFMALVKPTAFTVYGPASDEVKKMIAGFNPVYMTEFDGFVR